MTKRIARAAAILILTVSACAPVRFNTELTSTDSLAPGDPVRNMGAVIGSVAETAALPDGNSSVAFDIHHSDARLMLQDSIMVLRNDNGPALELLNIDPLSLQAPAGATIIGAADQQQADLLVAARTPGLGPGLAMMVGALGGAANMPPGMVTAPAANTLQQQLNALRNWYAANGARNAAAAAQQVRQLNQSAAALERELIDQGHSLEAQQLRDEIEQLARTLSGAPPSSPLPPH